MPIVLLFSIAYKRCWQIFHAFMIILNVMLLSRIRKLWHLE